MPKKLFFLILIPGLLLIGGYLYLRFSLQSSINNEEKKTGIELPTPDTLGGKKTSAADLRPLFIKRLQVLLKSSSAHLYNLSVSDLNVDVLSSSVTLQGVKMTPDSAVLDSLKKIAQLPADVFTVSFDSLHIEGVNLDDALTGKMMDYTLVKLVKPVIVVHHKKAPAKKDSKGKDDFAQRFLKEMEKLSVKEMGVEDGTAALYNDRAKTAPVKLNKVTARFKNVLLDSLTRRDKKRFLFAEEAAASFHGYDRPTADGLYNMKVDAVEIKEPQQKVLLKGFSFTSPYNRTEFSARQKESEELYNLRLPSITVENVNWWALLNEEEMVAGAVDVPGGKLAICLDRSQPPKNKTGNFPNQLLMKLPVQMNIANINPSGLDFSYAEYNPVSQQTGTIYMDNVKLHIAHASNLRTDKKPVVVDGSALFTHTVPLKAGFVFDKKTAAAGTFSASISAPGFGGDIVNSFAPAMGLVKVKEGTLQKVEATVKGNERKASANVLALYKGLKLELLEKDKGEKGLDKKGFTTFVANAFVLKKDNPKGTDAPRRADVSFTRIPEGGFFMLVWKTLLTGLLKTIGAPEKIAFKTVANTKKSRSRRTAAFVNDEG